MNPAAGKPPYGSGGFGRWTTDEFGLPAYLYTSADPRPWHQVGNDRITAVAHAGGEVELFAWETCAKWLNAQGRSSLGPQVAPAPSGPRPSVESALFGLGYIRHERSSGGLRWRETLYAPHGDFPFVVSRVDLTAPAAMEWVASWTPRPRELFFTFLRFLQGPLSPKVEWTEYDATRKIGWARVGGPRTLPAEPRRRDPWFPDLFLAHRSGPLAGPGTAGGRTLALRYRTGPGEARIETAAGYAYEPESIPGEVERAPSLEETVARWKGLADSWDLPEAWVAREAAWSAYYLRSAALHDRYLEAHSIPQGGLYLYRWGVNGAPRDIAQHGWPLIYLDPEMAREVLKFLFRLQRPSGELPWDYSGFGSRDLHIMEPSDSGLWLSWFATEYVWATRDFAVLDEEFPYYPKHEGRKGTGWDHLRASWRHLRDDVGTGAHGLIRLKFSDWSDEMAPDAGRNPLGPLAGWHHLRRVRRLGESTLNTAMACAVLPRLADLFRDRDGETEKEIREFAGAQGKVLRAQWRGRWFNRAYFHPRREVGRDRLYIEPQVWALLAGIPPEMEAPLLESLKTTSMRASPLGAVCLSPPEGQLTSRAGELTSGGIWHLLNMLLVEALSTRDPEAAWAETKRNTLANHATLHPGLWYGIWSGNDSWNGPASPRPGEAPTGRIPWLNVPAVDYRTWPVQIAHSHGALLYMLLKMAGVRAGPGGYAIDPRFPFPEFAFRGSLLEVRYRSGSAEGAILPRGGGGVGFQVRLPAGVTPGEVRVAVDGRPADFETSRDLVHFSAELRAGKRTSWSVAAKG